MLRLTLGLIICLPLAAQAERADPIPALLKTIEARAEQEADPAVRARVRALLEQAVVELRAGRRGRRGPSEPSACLAFAGDIYGRTLTEQAAQERAIAACAAPVFMPGLRYLFETYSEVRQARPAFERALAHARARDLRGRMRFLKFVVSVFDDTRTRQGALHDGLIFVDTMPRRLEACVRAGHATWSQTLQSLPALERARSTCLSADGR